MFIARRQVSLGSDNALVDVLRGGCGCAGVMGVMDTLFRCKAKTVVGRAKLTRSSGGVKLVAQAAVLLFIHFQTVLNLGRSIGAGSSRGWGGGS